MSIKLSAMFKFITYTRRLSLSLSGGSRCVSCLRSDAAFTGLGRYTLRKPGNQTTPSAPEIGKNGSQRTGYGLTRGLYAWTLSSSLAVLLNGMKVAGPVSVKFRTHH